MIQTREEEKSHDTRKNLHYVNLITNISNSLIAYFRVYFIMTVICFAYYLDKENLMNLRAFTISVPIGSFLFKPDVN